MSKWNLERYEADYAVKKLSPRVQELALDLTQFTLDLLGIVDQTGAVDLTNAVISLVRQDWWGAAISVVSAFPLVGDAAKLGKISKYQKTFVEAIELALKDAEVYRAFLPYFIKIRHVLEVVPGGDNVQIVNFIKRHLDDFFKQSKRFGEVLLRGKDEMEARNTAVRLMEDFVGKDDVMLKQRLIGSLEKSDFFGKEIGASYTITGRTGTREASIRIDWDPSKGPHYNVSLIEGGKRESFAVLFPASDETMKRIARRRTPPAER